MIENTIDGNITKVSRTLPQNSSETIAKETENVVLDRENKKELHIYLQKKQRKLISTNIQIKFKTLVLKSTLCDYSDAFILA